MADDPLLGKTLGNVRLTARLGQGAMGVVYRGWHNTAGCEVAVKILIDQSGQGHAKERFLREGQTAAKVRQENVVQVMEAGESGGNVYLVMELVIGHSLDRLIAEKGAINPEEVARLGVGIAKGLAAIHEQGIIHRDIKPDNILISGDKKPKITDLGLAKQHDDPGLARLTATGMVVGTPLFVSPEAIRDTKTVTIATDIYSLGATLYCMLTGKPPFVAESPYEVMRSHLEERVRPIRELKPATPVGLANLVERCLHKSPEKRPTAQQLVGLFAQGANLRSGSSLGLYVFIAVVVVVILGGAILGWSLLQAKPG
jgi:serine/threonine protein kinase